MFINNIIYTVHIHIKLKTETRVLNYVYLILEFQFFQYLSDLITHIMYIIISDNVI